AFCKQAYYNYALTSNASGAATIVTGVGPNIHGIISDNWYNDLAEKEMSCVEGDRIKYINGKVSFGNFSAKKILSSTIGDEIKLAYNDSSKVISIGMNPINAVLSGGRGADYAFWFEDATGEWITGNYYSDTLPQWLKDFNSKNFQDVYIKRAWTSFFSLNNYETSLNDDSKFEFGFSHYRKTFPYELSFLKSRSSDYKYLKYTPFGNTYTKDLANTIIIEEELGKDKYTDFLSVNFSGYSYLGKYFGPRSVETEDMFVRLDKDIAHFLKFIDDNIGKENVLIYFVSDHGVAEVPAYLKSKRMNAGIFNGEKSIALLESYLQLLYGDGKWINKYLSKQIYLNRKQIDKSNITRSEVQEKVVNFMTQFNGVANALSASTLQTTNFNSGVYKLMQNSFNQKRSGDVIINLEPGWIEKTKNLTSSGSLYNYDRHVPLIWYGWNVKNMSVNSEVDISNIAPTISWILGISNPNAAEGISMNNIIND
ncbi:MAG: alkaline phosphatase family protein, partial [Bacteroidota bacterium]|nr:alkaline phosphatase family protein [Bacteroidota bacterium]